MPPIRAGFDDTVMPSGDHVAAAEARKVVVELGTEEGNRHVFRAAPVSADERAWLEKHLLRPGQRLVTARFQPVSLPLVLVPDRDAELKQRLESDEADKRIAGATLKLARIYTRTLDATATADLYVNVDSPALRALLDARSRGDDAVAEGARLLRAIVALMAGWNEGSGRVDLSAALTDLTDTAVALFARRTEETP
jgi:molecular chaperone HtpG